MAEITLTPAQNAAIHDRGGAVLVSAAAGSGKTFVLVERLLARILDPQEACNIDDFLVITFTKKAAAELRTRITAKLSERLAGNPSDRHLAKQLSRMGLAQITTIDGFCSDLVRRHAFALNLSPDFRQIESAESKQLRAKVISALLEQCYAEIERDADFHHLADTLGAGRRDGELETAIAEIYQSAQCHLDPAAWIGECIGKLELSQYADAGHTPWGAQLLHAFRRFCAVKIGTLRAAIRLCAEEDILSGFAAALSSDIAMLTELAACGDWDTLHAYVPAYLSLPRTKKEQKTELMARVVKLRNGCKAALKKQLAAFYAPSQQVMEDLAQSARALQTLFSLVLRFDAAYTQEKRRLRVQDFSDLEHGAIKLLLAPDGSPTALAKELSQQYRELMLDEYQDTNEVQDRLFRAISRDGKNRFMVGDVKQAIYRFRLADPGIFLKKYKSYTPYAEALPGQPRKILLSENYRSGQEILEAANAVFSACMSEDVGELNYGEDEMLRQGLPRPALPGCAVELHCINTKPQGSASSAPDKDEVEADFVARRIRQLLDEQAPVAEKDGLRPVRPEDIVILLRSLRSNAAIYVRALQRYGLSCVSDRESNLLDAPEIETLVSLLRIIDNAHQDVPLAAVLMSPVFSMTADTLARIRAAHKSGDLWEALKASSLPQAAEITQTLSSLREAAAELELPALLTQLTQKTHLEELCRAASNGAEKLENLRRLFALAAAFSEGGKKSLSQFLARLDALQADAGDGLAARKNAVTLMSIHKSKGLEFPVVVLAGLSYQFNEEDLKKQVLIHPKLGAGCSVYKPEGRYRYHSIAKRAIISALRAESRSEELRILYVAMTRPKDRLIMSYCSAELESTLKALCEKLTLPPESLLATEAKCPGDWVLEAALLRTEAGALFAVGGKPDETAVSTLPWAIRYHEITALPQAPAVSAAAQCPQDMLDPAAVKQSLAFRYPAQAATEIPAKITATQLKGRLLDEEVSDGAPERSAAPYRPRKPSFETDRPLTPKERGTATHLAMQYIDFAKTDSLPAIEAELRRMVEEEFLTPQQAEAVSAERLLRIFAGPIGQKIAAADKVVREFKFSLLVDASLLGADVAHEQVLLQGVTDCCLIRGGRLTIIDFKTDRVQPGGEQAAAERYRGQLEAYSLALSRIFRLPVEEKLLYFFATDTPYSLT